MTHHVWSPADGPPVARQQLLPHSSYYAGDGHTERADGGLWYPTNGPLRSDPGGPGGEPNGRTVPVTGHSPLDES